MVEFSAKVRGEHLSEAELPTLRRYILVESGIGALINAALTAAFTTVMFAGRPAELWGVGGLAFDFIPATFLPVLAMTIGLTYFTRRRRRTGKAPASAEPPLPGPANPALRAILFGALATIVFGGAGAALMAWWWSPGVSFTAVFVFKLVYGAALGAAAAAIVVGAALRDPCVAVSGG